MPLPICSDSDNMILKKKTRFQTQNPFLQSFLWLTEFKFENKIGDKEKKKVQKSLNNGKGQFLSTKKNILFLQGDCIRYIVLKVICTMYIVM